MTMLTLPVVRDPNAPRPRHRRPPHRHAPFECFDVVSDTEGMMAFVGKDREGTVLIRIVLPSAVFHTEDSMKFAKIVHEYLMTKHDLIEQPKLKAVRGGAYLPSRGSVRRLRPRGITHWRGEERA